MLALGYKNPNQGSWTLRPRELRVGHHLLIVVDTFVPNELHSILVVEMGIDN